MKGVFMKKYLAILALMLAFSVSVFAQTWIIKSGTQDVNYTYFYSAKVYNKTGWTLDVNGTTIFNNSSWTIYDDCLIISSDSYNASQFKVYYTKENGTFVIYITK